MYKTLFTLVNSILMSKVQFMKSIKVLCIIIYTPSLSTLKNECYNAQTVEFNAYIHYTTSSTFQYLNIYSLTTDPNWLVISRSGSGKTLVQT